MKTLRTLIRIDAVLLAFFGLLVATSTYSVSRRGPVEVYHFDPQLIFLGITIAVLAVVLYTVSDFALIGHRRRLGTLLAAGNLVIAVAVIVAAQPSGWARGPGGIPPLVLLVMAMALAWASLRPLGPDDVAADLAALQIPDDIREALLRQIGEAAAQEERNRLARDLHDSIKQQLFTINVSTAAAQEMWERNPEKARGALADVRRSAKEAMVEMQALLHQLTPRAVATVGLVAAIREQCEALGYRTGAEVSLELGEAIPDDRLPPGAPETLFRIAQEALSNVARHARARTVRVWLGLEEEAAAFRVQDDGQGFRPGEEVSGMGLRNLMERAESLKGSLEIASAPGAGTNMEVLIPLIPSPVLAERRIQNAMRTERFEFVSLFVPLSLFLIIRVPLLRRYEDVLTLSSLIFATFLAVMGMSWWRERSVLRDTPGALPEVLFRWRYAVHQNRALSFLAASWWAPWYWRLAEEGWTLERRIWLAVALFLAGGAILELIRFHRVSENRPGWWEGRLRIRSVLASIFAFLITLLLMMADVVFFLGKFLWRLKPVELNFLLLGAAALLYTFSRRPRTEGVPS